MNTIQCLVVDDEELARTLLANYIARVPGLALAASCPGPFEAMQVLQQDKIDLLFLDIQMPELSGLEMLRTLPHKPVVIFTTAYPDYALEGYNLDVCDYLLKPISFERFVHAVNKAKPMLRPPGDQPEPKAEPGRDHLLIKADHKIHRLKYDDILYIQSMREYAAFYTHHGRILSLMSLRSLEEELPPERFIRIHKSYIVSVNKIDSLEGNTLHIGKAQLPIGANYREGVMEKVFG